MAIEIINIGGELLSGIISNTNAAFMSSELFKAGWEVSRHLVLPDDEQILHDELKAALKRSTIVITTGGLGDTLDDWTKKVATKMAEHLPTREFIPNPFGTASGLLFSSDTSTLICLPGVPREMEIMLQEYVIPYLQKHYPKARLHSASLSLCLLNENDVDPTLRNLKEEYPSLQIGIYTSYGTLLLIFRDKEKKIVEEAYQRVAQEFYESLFPSLHGKIEEAIQAYMVTHKKTLAFAESCSGGRLAARLTSLSGSSQYFLGSVVCYSNHLKEKILGVSHHTLKGKGAVSGEVAQEMVKGVLNLTGADLALAITGIAGPTGGSVEKPIGTMWAALQWKGQDPDLWSFLERGSRDKILYAVTNRILARLWKNIIKK